MKVATRHILLSTLLLTMTALSFLDAQQKATVNDNAMTVSTFEDMGYPPLARQTRTQGIVVVQVQLDKDGKVADAVALSGADLLTAASVSNAMKWRFRPNAQRMAIIVYNFRMPRVICNSKNVASFSVLQAPNFVSITGCEVPVEP